MRHETKALPTPWIDPLLNQILSKKYFIQEKIGEGGLAAVYKAGEVNTEGEGQVAIKILHEEHRKDPSLCASFREEARKMVKLRGSENIITIYGIEEDDPCSPYLVMEYFEGITLERFITRKERLSQDTTLAIGLKIADGIKKMHEKGILHCDIHPGNILLQPEDNHVKVADLGVSSIKHRGQPVKALPFGVLEYTSPERVQDKKVDEKSDIYSLGMLLYQMMTGKNYFYGRDESEIVHELADSAKEFSLSFPNTIHPKLQRLIRSLLKKDPQERITLGDFQREVEQIRKSIGTRKTLLIFRIPIVIAMILLGLVLYFRQDRPKELPTPPVEVAPLAEVAPPVVSKELGIQEKISVPPASLPPRIKEASPEVGGGTPKKQERGAVAKVERPGLSSVVSKPDQVDSERLLHDMKLQLDDLKRVYEKKDLATLQKNTQMSPKTAQLFKELFENYSKIKITISAPVWGKQDQSVGTPTAVGTPTTASATLQIISLTNNLGNLVRLTKEQSTVAIQFHNVEGQWRIHW